MLIELTWHTLPKREYDLTNGLWWAHNIIAEVFGYE